MEIATLASTVLVSLMERDAMNGKKGDSTRETLNKG